jgi:hypothetical protein
MIGLKKILFFSMAVCSLNILQAQDTIRKNLIEASIGAGKNITSANIAWHRESKINKKRTWHFNYGVRYTMAYSNKLAYITADPNIAKENSILGGLFAKDIPAHIDTITMGEHFNMGFNIFIGSSYYLSSKIQLGFNIDIIGLGFGSNQSPQSYLSADYDGIANMIIASPRMVNVMLIAGNDIGFLNSALYARYYFKNNQAIVLSVNHLISELKTNAKVVHSQYRFRNVSNLIQLAWVMKF